MSDNDTGPNPYAQRLRRIATRYDESAIGTQGLLEELLSLTLAIQKARPCPTPTTSPPTSPTGSVPTPTTTTKDTSHSRR